MRLAFTRAVGDWYYNLIPFAILNLLWFLLVLTIVAGPPATAAMLGVARDAAVGEGVEPRNFFIYLRRFFWRAWGLGIFTFLVSLILLTDLQFFVAVMRGSPFLSNIAGLFLFYVPVVWLEFLLFAWPLLVNQPEMSLPNVLRNAAILTLRTPGANLGLALVVIFLSVLSFFLAIAVSLALAALVSMMAQHYIHTQASNPPRRGALTPRRGRSHSRKASDQGPQGSKKRVFGRY